jgi:LPXTG-site transpeptidase (sortase) family protein
MATSYKGHPRAKVTLIVIGLFGFACGAGIMLAYYAIASSGGLVGQRSLTVAPVGAPAWLIIPRIHVDAPIKPVGVDAQGNLGVPSDAVHVAWYKNGPRPGMPGAAVIDGHLDTKTTPQAVFYNLDELKPGDEMDVLTEDGQTVVFKVASVKEYAYNASTSGIFVSNGTAPELNLITCAGDWVPEKKIYDRRLVVFGVRR